MCNPCYPEFAARVEQSQKRQAKQEALWAEWTKQRTESQVSESKARISANAARLVQHGSPGLQQRWTMVQELKKHGWGKKSYRWTGGYVKKSLPSAWLVGNFSWTRQVPSGWADDVWENETRAVDVYVTTAGAVVSAVGEPGAMSDVWREIDSAFAALTDRLLR